MIPDTPDRSSREHLALTEPNREKLTVRVRFIRALLSGYYKILEKTVTIEGDGRNQVISDLRASKPVVLSTPHTVLLPAVLSLKGLPATFLASKSEDGSLITYVLEQAGFSMVRGSSSRGAVAGLASSLKAVQPGRCMGLTFDGPKGPPLIPKKGVALLSKMAPESSYFYRIEMLPRFRFWRGFLRLSSWDRFHLPLPFSRIRASCEALPSGSGREVLEVLEKKARSVYGDLYGP